MQKGTFEVKVGLAEMLKGGVIMDVTNLNQAQIAEDAGAVAVMALERIPSDIRSDGGIARMSDPLMIKEIQENVDIPVMAKCRIGHFAEAQILEALEVDFIDESEVLSPADDNNHIYKHDFKIPFVCGARNLGEALRRIGEGAAMIRTKGEAGSGNIVEAVRHMRCIVNEIKQLATLKVGDPTDKDNHVGPIARPDLRDNLHRQVQETIDQGAVCVMGGTLPDGDGYFYPVTLLKDVTPDMCAYREETFGPVAVIIKADNAAQALEMANDTPYGLGASVWTADTAKGEEMAREIVAGQVSVNGIVKTDPRLPSGGVKKSGYGRELGPHGIREFTNAQQIWVGPVKS